MWPRLAHISQPATERPTPRPTTAMTRSAINRAKRAAKRAALRGKCSLARKILAAQKKASIQVDVVDEFVFEQSEELRSELEEIDYGQWWFREGLDATKAGLGLA